MGERALVAVASGKKRTDLREIEVPRVAPEAGLLRVEAVGVCGTDWSRYKSDLREPEILGHHTVGRVESVGEAAAQRWGVEEGDRVVLEEYVPCGSCERCRGGEARLCDSTDPWLGGIRYGATPVSVAPSLWGGFGQYQYLHPNAMLHKVSDHVPAPEAALALPLSNGFEWVCLEGGRTVVGSTVVIQGPGQLGLACVIAAREAGAERVVISGLSADAERLELAKRLGADHAVDVERDDLAERVAEITEGRMADLVIDAASGGPSTVTSAIEIARKRGTVLLGGFKGEPLPRFPSDVLISKCLTLKGVRGHSYESVELALRTIASGRYPLGEMCTHRFGLSEVDEALRTMGGESGSGAVHVVVAP
ncbi:zinc-binding dehydrogenase [Rubrobacter marinus]|uniref:Zinc-binding dehydrogenase n=1 Tax=Rubrobacter marinus TaxID=2653852 RepID=A0A6G8Q0I8_9ACTN|nr:zinc-binding dehydrogenase [Rubrobacter marinus]QIN79976.1 zinc-binding dehydrogenase [Rubrobacter marinus]